MPVTGITTDIDTRTLTITAEFAAPVTRIWAMYADPRQLEQVWGPPEYPATFVDHDLRPAPGRPRDARAHVVVLSEPRVLRAPLLRGAHATLRPSRAYSCDPDHTHR